MRIGCCNLITVFQAARSTGLQSASEHWEAPSATIKKAPFGAFFMLQLRSIAVAFCL